MKVKVMIFGRLTDIVGSSTLSMADVGTTDELIKQMNKRYPALVNSKFAIAVNRQVINEPVRLDDNSIVALLPPSSGG